MRELVFDTESDGFFEDATKLWCAASVVLGEDEVKSYTFEDVEPHPKDIDLFMRELDMADVIIGHNIIKHDLPLLKKLWDWEPSDYHKIVDTLLMSRMQRPDRRAPPHASSAARRAPHGVEAWGYRLGDYKVEHEEWDRYSPEMLERCVQDTKVQVKIFDALLKEGKGEGWGPCHRLNSQLFNHLFEQEQNGMAFDEEFAKVSLARLDRWIERIDRAVTPLLPLVLEIQETKQAGEWGWVKKPFVKNGNLAAISKRFMDKYKIEEEKDAPTIAGPFSRVKFRYTNLNSNAEVKDYLLKSGWIPEQWNENNQGERTSPKMTHTDPFNGVSGGLGALLVRRVRCGHRRGVIQGWLDYLEKKDPYIPPRLPSIVTGLAVTGRAKHKLIVNVPGGDAFFGNDMRRMFVASPGKVLVGVDSVANQIRQLAARMGDEEFIKVVLDPDIDMHSYNQEKGRIALRSQAKTFFYALIFGAGDGKIARNLGISFPEAKELRHSFMGGLPALQDLLDRLKYEWNYNGGWIEGLDGRPIFVPSEHMLLVYLLQSDEAIQMAHAYCLLYDALKDWEADVRFVLWMHDEFQLEARPDEAPQVARLGCWSIKEAGEQLGINIPHEGDAKIGSNWMETH